MIGGIYGLLDCISGGRRDMEGHYDDGPNHI